MTVRFRIRTQAGQELSFASREMFEDFVRSGDLSPADLVYDGETASWSPARTHPIVLEVEYADEYADTDSGKSKAPAADPSADNAFGLSLAGAAEAPDREGADEVVMPGGDAADGAAGNFGLELALQDEVSPEEASRAFVEKLKAERESERDLGRSEGVGGFTMETSGALADLVHPASPEPPPRREPTPRRDPEPRPRSEPRRIPAAAERSGSTRGQAPPERRPASKTGSGGGARRVVGMLVVVALLAAGGIVGVRLATSGAGDDAPAPVPEVPVEAIPVEPRPTPPPVREPVIASTEAAVTERAHERFLTATQAELRDLQPVPEAWVTAEYLTLPSVHPDVVDVFQSYLTTIGRVRAGDESRYRAAYVAALEDAGVAGEEATGRLDAAMTEFAASTERREAHYDRVEALASAAIRSHEALLEAEGLLVPGAPSDGGDASAIGAGVAGRDEASQLLMEEIVELIGAVLDGEGAGPRTPANVRAWVWDGLLDAVTR